MRIVRYQKEHHDQWNDEQDTIRQQEEAPQVSLIFQVSQSAHGAMTVQLEFAPVFEQLAFAALGTLSSHPPP
jgi:hypothetical protein